MQIGFLKDTLVSSKYDHENWIVDLQANSLFQKLYRILLKFNNIFNKVPVLSGINNLDLKKRNLFNF